MPELIRPESRPPICPSSDYDAPIYTSTSSGYEPSAQLPPQFSIPPSMPPPQAPPMHASPSYASMSGSGSSSQSSPAYSQGPMPSPHTYGQTAPDLFSVQAPTTPSYDSPMAGLGVNVGEPSSHHGSVPPEEPSYMMGSADHNNLPPSFVPCPHGMLPTQAWQTEDGLPPRPNTGETWQDFGKYH
ncbi:hypothetical protein B0F90DRAFT_614051 [Multifurca ochricompacta]|uniref:Uncharacterized protein n=1 Tax=Multifurca ochricompacta TaxID=376703 RepID=A0AAD4M2G9_9AGAM|nr:hypothetical protein B0F90DRAFT_614051 [Multifurca ochricompacta]